jgi:Cu2+-exporting ATPase
MSSIQCEHCGLPVPPDFESENDELSFCCNGCRTVYHAISDAGLETFYGMPRNVGEGQPALTTDHSYEEFGDDSFTELYVRKNNASTYSVDLYLEGIHCASCVWLVERLPHVLPGVIDVRLDARRHVAEVVWDPSVLNLPAIARRLDGFGYPVHPYQGADVDAIRRRENRKHLARIGVAGAIAGNVMLLAFALYGGAFSGIDERYRHLLRVTSFLLTLLAVLWPGRVFLRGAWSSLRAKTLHMDVPVALALVVGTGWGGFNTFSRQGEVYFESLTAVIFLLLVGRWVQYRQQRVASDAVELLFSLTPIRARRIQAGGNGPRITEVPISALIPGDRIEVLAGETLPADGRLVLGNTSLDLATLSGESHPVKVTPGAELNAGTTNLDSRIEMVVQATGVHTRIGALMQMVEQGAHERPSLVRMADRISHRFVLLVLLLALTTVIIWLYRDPSRAAEQTVALLIVTCPCALGLATPLAFQAAIGRAARAGILIKNGEAIERLARAGTLLLDKTGTVTTGHMELLFWRGSEELKGAVQALEAQVSHPVSRALSRGLVPLIHAPEDLVVTTHMGLGISGTLSGRLLQIGSVQWAQDLGAESPDWLPEALIHCEKEAATPILILADGKVQALAAIGDRIHENSPASIERLQAAGWKTCLVSGDHPPVVQAVAAQVGIPPELAMGGVQPEAKLLAVREARAQGTVVMVGDGVNDAAALSAADCGIAVHGGAEASLRAADIYLSYPGLDPLVHLFAGAKRTLGVVRRNFGASLLYNAVAASGAMMGWIHPLLAAALMPLSSLTVVTLSYRSRTFDKPS